VRRQGSKWGVEAGDGSEGWLGERREKQRRGESVSIMRGKRSSRDKRGRRR
jgi:hypothetical protein